MDLVDVWARIPVDLARKYASLTRSLVRELSVGIEIEFWIAWTETRKYTQSS